MIYFILMVKFMVAVSKARVDSISEGAEKCGATLPFLNDSTRTCDLSTTRCCNAVEERCDDEDPDCICNGCVDNELFRNLEDSGDSCVVSVVNGFLKNVCHDKESSSLHFKCIESDQTYEFRIIDRNRVEFSKKCESDSKSYQACGFTQGVVTNKADSACGWWVCPDRNSNYIAKNYPCDGDPVPIGCDGKCDISTCVDESSCNGRKYGITCKGTWGKTVDLPVEKICDGSADCDDKRDENDCEIEDFSTLQSCPHIGNKNETVPIHNYTRCAVLDLNRDPPVLPYCVNLHDQTNCSDSSRLGGQCKVGGFLTNVSESAVCSGLDLCDDGSHNLCNDVSIYCQNIHKHKFCDGVEDCLDGSDEANDVCAFMTKNLECTRFFGNQEKRPIPRSWIQDNFTDCLDGIDETVSSNFCNVGGEGEDDIGYFRAEDETCENVFLCPKADSADGSNFVKFDVLCDTKESCSGAENEVCAVSRDFPRKNTTVPFAENTEGFVKELCNQSDSESNCAIRQFPYPVSEVFGVDKIKLNVANNVVDCSNKFGEYYVYYSCMGLCESANSTCPLKNEMLNHDSCPRQYSDRVLTLADSSHLTFVTKSAKRGYHSDIFQCDNGRCVNYSQVCDLVNDCEDMSDEMNCNNHFICESSLEKEVMQLIGNQQKCDGIYDCLDLSDECNGDCTRRIIHSDTSLTPFCWVIGTLSTLLNICALSIVPTALRRCRNENVLFSKSLVMLIFIGDLMMGIYLIALSVYDDIIYKEDFCKMQADWFTGTECKALGIISTIGSQLSLFAMTALSVFRLFKVLTNGLPLPVIRRSVVRSVTCTVLISVLSVAVAIIPLIPFLDDHFVQGMFYDPDYQVFVGLNTKIKHINILKKYYPKENLSVDISWEEISKLVDGMFSRNYGILDRHQVHFYGNDGSCMFKYIVPTNDARRERGGSFKTELNNDPVVWVMLTINLICFVVILFSAIVICQKSRRSTSKAGQTTNKVARKRNRNLELRILAIVVTDFLCWVPFIIICYLHNQGIVDASTWYQALALVVLPINSLINPMIYDRTITRFCKRRLNSWTSQAAVVHENIAATSQAANDTGNAKEVEMQFLKEL
ncbi:hypothetical protein ACHWQZ_G016945 [Mnemiopsis leidyi]